MTLSVVGAFFGALEKSKPVTLPSATFTTGAVAGGVTSCPSGPSMTFFGSTERTSITNSTVSVGFSCSCGAPALPHTSLTVAAIATREPWVLPTRPSMMTLKNWFSFISTWVGVPWSVELKSLAPSAPLARKMLNIALWFATTGLPFPAVITSVSGLSTLTAGLTLTCGSCPNAPVTVRPLIASASGVFDELESSPQAAVANSISDATNRASRRRTKKTPQSKGKVRTATIAGDGKRAALERARGGRGPSAGLHAFDEFMHPLVVRAERVLAEDGALRLVVELQVHPVHREVAPTLLGTLDELSPEPGPRGLGRDGLRLEHPEVVGHPGDRTTPFQEVVKTSAPVDVVVREVQLRDPRVAQRQPVLGAVALEQLPLDHPVDLPLDEAEVLRLHGLERPLPQVEDPRDQRRLQVPAGDEVGGPGGVLVLDVQRAAPPAVGEPHLAATGHVVRDLPDGPDRVLHREVAHHHALLDHPQHQVARGDLEHRRRLAHVRGPDDHVQPPVALGVGVRLVAGVDDRPGAGGGAGDALPDVLGPLGHRVQRAAGGLDHLPGAADDLTGRQEREHQVH